MTDDRADLAARLADWLDGDDGRWYDAFGLWTVGKRDTAWLADRIAADERFRALALPPDVETLRKRIAATLTIAREDGLHLVRDCDAITERITAAIIAAWEAET